MRDRPVDHKTNAYLRGSTVLVHRRIRCCRPSTGHSCNACTPPRSLCSPWTALAMPRHEPGVSVMMVLLRPARVGSCSSSEDLQHSAVWVLFSPSAMLDFSPSRERVSSMEARSPYHTRGNTKCSRPTSYLYASISGKKVTSAPSIALTYLATWVTSGVMSMGPLPVIIFC